jgi:mono/diheme cytochrome c family protein
MNELAKTQGFNRSLAIPRLRLLFALAALLNVFWGTRLDAQQTNDSVDDERGAALVATKCSLCHTDERIVSVRRTKADWYRVVKEMWERRAPISEKDIPVIADFLYKTNGKADSPPVKRQAIVSPAGYDFSRPVKRGTITGMVTVDQGQVHAFMVSAHNLLYRVQYKVYTKDGRYTVPEALPGTYEITGDNYGYTVPTEQLKLEPGETKSVNLTAKKDPEEKGITYVDLNIMFTPGPGHDLYIEYCRGCHIANNPHYEMQLSEYGYHQGLEYMRWGRTIPNGSGPTQLGRTQLSTDQMNSIAHYLGTLFDPFVKRELRRPDYPIDENVTSKGIFVQYDMPDQVSEYRRIGFHDAYMAVDGSIWFGADYNNSGAEYRVRKPDFCSCGFVARLDPKQLDPNKRWTLYYPPKSQDFDVNGIGEDMVRHHIYFADMLYGKLGEVDPKNETVTLHDIPAAGFGHAIYGDSKGNIWYGNIQGSTFGKYDPATGHMYMYATLTEDFGPYGTAEDHNGNLWITGDSKSRFMKFDPRTQVITEYQTPTLGSGPRRIGVDMSGNLWISESAVGAFARINPDTAEITEFKLPVQNISPYFVRPDKKNADVIWGWDFLNKVGFSPFSYNYKTNKMVYYPAPNGSYAAQDSVENNNTEWHTQQLPTAAGSHFYPEGYTADAPPEP